MTAVRVPGGSGMPADGAWRGAKCTTPRSKRSARTRNGSAGPRLKRREWRVVVWRCNCLPAQLRITRRCAHVSAGRTGSQKRSAHSASQRELRQCNGGAQNCEAASGCGSRRQPEEQCPCGVWSKKPRSKTGVALNYFKSPFASSPRSCVPEERGLRAPHPLDLGRYFLLKRTRLRAPSSSPRASMQCVEQEMHGS